MNREKAINELKKINNTLTLLMKKKKALQKYIQEENARISGVESPKEIAWRLKKDEEFIKMHGRERTEEEVAEEMFYSVRQVQRYLGE